MLTRCEIEFQFYSKKFIFNSFFLFSPFNRDKSQCDSMLLIINNGLPDDVRLSLSTSNTEGSIDGIKRLKREIEGLGTLGEEGGLDNKNNY